MLNGIVGNSVSDFYVTSFNHNGIEANAVYERGIISALSFNPNRPFVPSKNADNYTYGLGGFAFSNFIVSPTNNANGNNVKDFLFALGSTDTGGIKYSGSNYSAQNNNLTVPTIYENSAKTINVEYPKSGTAYVNLYASSVKNSVTGLSRNGALILSNGFAGRLALPPNWQSSSDDYHPFLVMSGGSKRQRYKISKGFCNVIIDQGDKSIHKNDVVTGLFGSKADWSAAKIKTKGLKSFDLLLTTHRDPLTEVLIIDPLGRRDRAGQIRYLSFGKDGKISLAEFMAQSRKNESFEIRPNDEEFVEFLLSRLNFPEAPELRLESLLEVASSLDGQIEHLFAA